MLLHTVALCVCVCVSLSLHCFFRLVSAVDVFALPTPQLVLRSKVIVVGDSYVGKSALTQMFYSSGASYPKNYSMVRRPSLSVLIRLLFLSLSLSLSLSVSHTRNFQTVGADLLTKKVVIPDSVTQVELFLFDCGGQPILHQREWGTKFVSLRVLYVFSTSTHCSHPFPLPLLLLPMLKSQWENGNMLMVVYDVSNRESFQSCSKWVQRVQETMHRKLPGVLIANKSDLRAAGRAVVDEKEGRALAKSLGLEYFETALVRSPLVPWSRVRPVSALSHAVVRDLQEGSPEFDAPFHFLADQFNRSYHDTMERVTSEMY